MLTHKKRKFADAIFRGASNREAAIKAEYSEKTASQAGSKLAKDPDVLAHIKRLEEAGTVNPGLASTHYDDPKEFLVALMNDSAEDPRLRAEAAKALLPYEHAKLGEKGKKEKQAEAAEKAAKGRFKPRVVK